MYREKKSFFTIFVIFIISAVLIVNFNSFFGFFSGYYSTDSKSDKEVIDYLKKYIKEKYDMDCDLKLVSKRLMQFGDFCFDGSCIINYSNNNIYQYKFDGVDSNNYHFSISYSNSYAFGFKKYDSAIFEDCYINYNRNEIEKLIKKDFNDYKIYFSTENKNYRIVIYDKNFGINKLISLKNNIYNLFHEKTFSCWLIVVNDDNLYEKFKSSNYESMESANVKNQILSNDYKLIYKHKIKSDVDLLPLYIDNENYVIVLFGDGHTYGVDEEINLYIKQNNNDINRNW